MPSGQQYVSTKGALPVAQPPPLLELVLPPLLELELVLPPLELDELLELPPLLVDEVELPPLDELLPPPRVSTAPPHASPEPVAPMADESRASLKSARKSEWRMTAAEQMSRHRGDVPKLANTRSFESIGWASSCQRWPPDPGGASEDRLRRPGTGRGCPGQVPPAPGARNPSSSALACVAQFPSV